MRLLTPGFVATVSSFALAVLAGAGVLALAAAPSNAAEAPALYTAGIAMAVVNFTVARLLFAPFYHRIPPRHLIRAEFVDLAPAVLSMLALGVIVWVLIEPLGALALLPLALAALVPQLAVARLSRARSVWDMSYGDAAALYGAALGDVLRLRRRDRRLLATAIRLSAGPRYAPEELLDRPLAELQEAGFIVLHSGERWDGRGWPAALRGPKTPRLSRVLAVTLAWSDLTAAGTAQLTHAEALLDLASRSGTEFDPEVVAAASQVVRDEEAYAGAASFAPRLHNIALPRAVRREALPAALARLSGAPTG